MKKGNSKVLLPGLGGIVCCPTLTNGLYQNKAVLWHIIKQVTNHQEFLPSKSNCNQVIFPGLKHLPGWGMRATVPDKQAAEDRAVLLWTLLHATAGHAFSTPIPDLNERPTNTNFSEAWKSGNFAIYFMKKMKLDQILPLFNKDLLWGASAELWNLSNTMLCRESKCEFGSMLWTRRKFNMLPDELYNWILPTYSAWAERAAPIRLLPLA